MFLPQFLFCRSTSRHALKHATLVPIFPWCCSLKNKNAFIFCRWVFCFLAICSIFYPSCRLKCIFSWSVVQKSLPSSIGAKLVAIQLLYRKSSQPVRSNPSNLSSRAHIIRPSLRGSGKRMLNRMHKKTWCVYNPTMFLRLFSLERSLLDHTGS